MKNKLTTVISLILSMGCAAPRFGPAPRSASYPLLNPLLAASDAIGFRELQPFNFKIKALADERKKERQVEHVTVYFRDLENGPVRGLDIEEKFTPASLLKVPLLIAALKQAEAEPGFLAGRMKFDVPSRNQSYLSVRALYPGTEYTVEQVIAAMASASDNDAFALLRATIPVDAQNAVFQDFGLSIPTVRNIEDEMSIREYATFFRVLYNASYLSKEMSQKALGYLAESGFKQGLVAGVPAGVPVAHKYGERFYSNDNLRQLHDCGIVYHPNRHYILCVMTRGADFDKLSGFISDVSRLIYREVDEYERGLKRQ